MGQFPYECPTCGGGYKRCGTDHSFSSEDDEECEGGQFCWNENVIIEINFNGKKIYLKGCKYTGYGNVILPDHEKFLVHSNEFSEYFIHWNHNYPISYCNKFYCEDCLPYDKEAITLKELNQCIIDETKEKYRKCMDKTPLPKLPIDLILDYVVKGLPHCENNYLDCLICKHLPKYDQHEIEVHPS